jgi:multisubunit Na+/H+ antiporter MnhE subunit
MIIKYLSFVIGLMWSYSLIRTHSIFNKKSALIFKLLISKVSWLTFIAGCYFGYKNFSIKAMLIGIVVAVIIVHLSFHFLASYLRAELGEKNLSKVKSFFEYALIALIIYFIFNWFQ